MSAHEEARGCPSPPPPAPATGPAHVARPRSSAQLPDLSLGQKQPRRLGPVRSGQRAVARQGHRKEHRFPRRVGELCERGTAAPGSPGPWRAGPRGGASAAPAGGTLCGFEASWAPTPRQGSVMEEAAEASRDHEISRRGIEAPWTEPRGAARTHAGLSPRSPCAPISSGHTSHGQPKGQRAQAPSLGSQAFPDGCTWKHQSVGFPWCFCTDCTLC